MEALKLWFIETFTDLKDTFILCFIDDDRWKWLVEGFGKSIIITLGAIAIGLVFGMLGDIWLDLKFVHKDFDEPYTFAGMFSFLIGHIFYVVGILAAYPEFIGWQIALAIFSAVAVTLIVRLASKKMGFEYGKFNALTTIYSVVTMLTVTFALNAVNAFGWLPVLAGSEMPEIMPRLLCMNMGTVMFALSDLVLSFVFFKKGGNTSRNVVLNHSVYFTSQFILALSILM